MQDRKQAAIRPNRFGSLFNRNRNRQALIARATELAQSGRHLALFDRDTGLYAFWYLQRRCVEEAERATRYERPLSAFVLDALIADQDKITSWLIKSLRSCDVASHLEEGRYFLLLPETSWMDAVRLGERITEYFPRVKIGIAEYPRDGIDYATLSRAAVGQLSAPAIRA